MIILSWYICTVFSYKVLTKENNMKNHKDDNNIDSCLRPEVFDGVECGDNFLA